MAKDIMWTSGCANRDRDAIALSIETNHTERALSFSRGPNGLHDDTGPVLWSYIGCEGQVFNRVSKALIDAGDEQEQIARTIARFAEWRTSFWWTIGPRTRPADLSRHLLDAGFTHIFTGPAMALDMDLLPPTWNAPSGITIRHLSHADALADWNAIEFLPKPPGASRSTFNEYVRIPSSHAPDWFVAYRDGNPVSRCLTFIGSDPDVIGLYWLTTAPEAMRQGIGGALSWYALDHARTRGCKLAVLVASEPGEGLYRKFGFEEYCRFEYYAWKYAES